MPAGGEPCWLTESRKNNTVLLGHTEYSKKDSKWHCSYENPITDASFRHNEFVFLISDFHGVQRTLPDRDPMSTPEFINRFGYCHPDSAKAKKVELQCLLQLKDQDRVCFLSGLASDGASGLMLGFMDTEKNECKSINVGIFESSTPKMSAEMKQVCLWELLPQSGWAVDGPKGYKDSYNLYKDWKDAMVRCQSDSRGDRYKYPYCSFDKKGYYYLGKDIDRTDTEGGANTVLRYRCLYEMTNK